MKTRNDWNIEISNRLMEAEDAMVRAIGEGVMTTGDVSRFKALTDAIWAWRSSLQFGGE